MPTSRVSAALRLAVLPAVVGIALLVAWRLGYFELDGRSELAEVVSRIRGRPWAEVVFVAGFAIAIAVCLPANIGTLVAGAIFGTWLGGLLAVAGGLLATAIAYWAARTIARRPVLHLFGEHRLLTMLKEHDGILELFRLRIIPVAPFAVLAYLAGVARISLSRLIAATAIGGIPAATAYAFAGSELLKGITTTSGSSKRAFIIAGSVTLTMLLLSVVVGIVRKRRG